MREIDEMIENFHENEDEMTEQQMFDAVVDIMVNEDFDSWDLLENLGIFYIPHSEWEDKYGNIQEEFYPQKANVSKYYRGIFTEAHVKMLMRYYKDFYEDMTTDWSDLY